MAGDFREFLDVLEKRGQLRRIKTQVNSDLEIANRKHILTIPILQILIQY
jgi:UbiD family decarboxylase